MLLASADRVRKPRKPARSRRISRPRLETLQDLLDAIQNTEPGKPALLSMLGAAAGHISMALQMPSNQISIGQLLVVKPDLQRHLQQRGFRRNSVRSYSNFLRILLGKARELGWAECSPEIEQAWEPLRHVLHRKAGTSGIMRYAIRSGLTPDEFTESHLANWRKAALRDGRSGSNLTHVAGVFRKAVCDAGLARLFPQLVFVPHDEKFYGIPISQFPEPLRTQVVDTLQWKTADFSPGRPRRLKTRPVSAKCLRWIISRIFGFLTRIARVRVSSLPELLSQQTITAYAEWCLNTRQVSARTVHNELGRICGLGSSPVLASQDFSWLLDLMAQLPVESYSLVKERKARKRIPYDDLARIPDQILREAGVRRDLSEKRRSTMGRNAFLIRFLTTMPWRQRNIRECRIRPFREGGNLWKEQVPSEVAKSPEVARALKANPHALFWQFHFRTNETKTGCPVRGILPRQLVAPLEEYLQKHWPILLDGKG